MPKNKEIPVLKGPVRDGQIFVWCPFCRRDHIHGLGGQDHSKLHHRGAHCSPGSSPFLETGYYIKVVPGVRRHRG